MRIVIDLDGVVCAIKEPHQTYEEVAPIPGAVDTLKR